LQKYRYYLPPQSKLPFAAGILSGLLCLDNIYTLISMPHYTQYWDYWATLAAALLLCVFCFLFRQRRTELTLIPAAILALIACITPNLVHWLEVGMFFLLLLLWLLRLPKWVNTLPAGWHCPDGHRKRSDSGSYGRTNLYAFPHQTCYCGIRCALCHSQSGRRTADPADVSAVDFRYASSCAAPLDRRKRPVRPHLGMTDIPMKNKNRTSGTVCRGYGFLLLRQYRTKSVWRLCAVLP